MVERIRRAAEEGWDDEQLRAETVELAAEILGAAVDERRPGERYQEWKMERMLGDEAGKVFTLGMADQVFRPRTAARSASQLAHLVEKHGVPGYLPWHERAGLKLAAEMGGVLPELVMPLMEKMLRHETRQVVLPGEAGPLKRHVKKRREMGARLNLNLLGEAILGEEEAARRLASNVERLADPDCDYLSVKISTIHSQINVLAYDDTLEKIKEPLRVLYRAAMTHPGADGTAKFVNLDMEDYQDLSLTLDAFCEVLDEEEFAALEAGIVLQAYLPESFLLQQQLTEWARDRVADGGAPVKLRLVKGANLAMERVEAALHGWEVAPYGSKAEVDANFKRMLRYACDPDHAAVVRVGVGSHNLFDIAYTLLLRVREGVEDWVEMEMLEGMANHLARVVDDLAGGMLFYAPVVKQEDFASAIAYLVRRLDENTAAENYLRDLFGMRVGGPRWERQRERFLTACRERDGVSSRPRREQNREVEYAVLDLEAAFRNEPDTDWTREGNRDWIGRALEAERGREAVEIRGGGEVAEVDPSEPWRVICRHGLAGVDEVEAALVRAGRGWREWGGEVSARRRMLKEAGCALGRKRDELIVVMVADGAKTVAEADVELSEAIDFANYYADSLSWQGLDDGVCSKPLGVVVVAPPWNFPLAIACGGVLAAIMAGNAVILKPSPEAVLTAWRLVEVLWEAGVPEDLLQFLPVPEDEVGKALLTDPRVQAVVLTGAHDTASLFLGWKPEMRLMAETSGKNAILITAAADPDQAVKDLVRSAFGHAGQKCSAASLAIVEAERYDDPAFMRQLRDAAASLPVGPAWDLSTVVPPVIREPGGELRRGLTELDAGEEWLLEPSQLEGNLWSPGIRIGVKADGWFRRTECFGPVLGVIRAECFEDGLRIQNASAFGLTGGLQSLDSREVAIWREEVEVGNAYVNRPITGAIVRRQPFGGWKNSAVGPGAKAGGPNYVLRLAEWAEDGVPELVADLPKWMEAAVQSLVALEGVDRDRIRAGAGSFARWWGEEFSVEHDPSAVLGESNVFRYRPMRRMVCRVHGMDPEDLALICLAAQTCGVELQTSGSRADAVRGQIAEITGATDVIESESELIGRLKDGIDAVRVLEAGSYLRRGAFGAGVRVADGAVLANGRLEMLHYLREQAVSEVTHRYGNLRGES